MKIIKGRKWKKEIKMENTKTYKVCSVHIKLNADTTFSIIVPNHLVDEGELDEEIKKEISNKFANGELDIDDLDEINVGNNWCEVGGSYVSSSYPSYKEMNKYPIFGEDE